VIADAVYADPGERAAIGAVAKAAGVSFSGIWLDASPQVLAARLDRRIGDPSDATGEVLQHQLTTGAGPVEWSRLDSSSDPEQVASAAANVIALAPF
jgi:predicted kinase